MVCCPPMEDYARDPGQSQWQRHDSDDEPIRRLPSIDRLMRDLSYKPAVGNDFEVSPRRISHSEAGYRFHPDFRTQPRQHLPSIRTAPGPGKSLALPYSNGSSSQPSGSTPLTDSKPYPTTSSTMPADASHHALSYRDRELGRSSWDYSYAMYGRHGSTEEMSHTDGRWAIGKPQQQQQPSSLGITKAGKPRKRLSQACNQCRDKKVKCDGLQSIQCSQCRKFGRECTFTTT